MPKDTEHNNTYQAEPSRNKPTAEDIARPDDTPANDAAADHYPPDHSEVQATKTLKGEDLPKEISDEDKETIKKVAGDDNLS